MSAYYLTPTTPGPAVVRVRRIRIGGQRSTVAASLVQQQDGAEVERITVLAVYGSLDRMSTEVQREIPPPDLPPVEECVEARLAPEEVRRMAPLLERFGTRLDPAYVGWAVGEPSGNGIIQGWFKLADDRPLDPIALLLVVDALPPVTFDLGLPGLGADARADRARAGQPGPRLGDRAARDPEHLRWPVRGGLRGLGLRGPPGRAVAPACAATTRTRLNRTNRAIRSRRLAAVLPAVRGFLAGLAPDAGPTLAGRAGRGLLAPRLCGGGVSES